METNASYKLPKRWLNLPAYQPIEPFEVLSDKLGIPIDSILKLDANENPYGPSPKARQALANLPFAHIYPDAESRRVRAALAGYTGAPAENLLAGAGADELIDLLLRVMLEPGDKVLICPPTFGMYAFDAEVNGAGVVAVPRLADFSLDLDGIRRAVREQQPKVIFLPSPNNPDGRLMTRAEIDAILALPVLVVLDEAYIEFAEDGGRLGEETSLIGEVSRRQNLVVLRTFSKWAGLAGLRLGYGAFPDWLMRVLWSIKQPYNVNVAAAEAAIASLDDLAWLEANVQRLRADRQRLFNRLAEIPFLQPSPSQANFILCKVKGCDARELKDSLAQLGILVRYYDTPLLKNYIRISVGTPEGVDRITGVLLDKVQDTQLAAAIRDKWLTATQPSVRMAQARCASLQRKTRETDVRVDVCLDGSGAANISTGLGFLDHMLTQIAVHGLFDLKIKTSGDLEVDPHHTVEDTALVLGEAFSSALGERRGIRRMASALAPMDESLAEVVVDFSGRPFAVIDLGMGDTPTGNIPASLWAHFFQSFAQRAGCSLHVNVLRGVDDHHRIEAAFKALARALDAAVAEDPRRKGLSVSSKGSLTV